MYHIFLYKLPYSRDVHTHFTSVNAEENYMKQYLIDPSPVSCERVLNPNAGVLRVTLKDFPIPAEISYAVVCDVSNGEFYYYYVTGFNVLSSGVVELFTEIDEYHNYFNYRGSFIEFNGNLLQSNSSAVSFLYPTGAPFYKDSSENFLSNTSVTAVAYLILQKSGVMTLRLESNYAIARLALADLIAALKNGSLDIYFGTTKQSTETFTLLNCFLFPSDLVKKETAPSITYKSGVYTFYACEGLSVSKKVQPLKETSNFFGTPFNKINIGNNEEVTTKAQLFALNGEPTLMISLNSTIFLDVTSDFSVAISYSEFSQYLAQNKISLAMNTISAIAGLGSGIATGNPIPIMTGIKTGVDIANDIYQASERGQNVISNKGGNALVTFNESNGLSIQHYTTKDQNKLDNTVDIFGGDCQNEKISFYKLMTIDSETELTSFYYQFSAFSSFLTGFYKVENMFKNGIFIRYVNE